jgi:hypothetical protein
MALSQMGVPGNTSGSDGVYRRSADSGITEIDDTGRPSWTDTFYCPAGPRWGRGVGAMSARGGRCYVWLIQTAKQLTFMKKFEIMTWLNNQF